MEGQKDKMSFIYYNSKYTMQNSKLRNIIVWLILKDDLQESAQIPLLVLDDTLMPQNFNLMSKVPAVYFTLSRYW